MAAHLEVKTHTNIVKKIAKSPVFPSIMGGAHKTLTLNKFNATRQHCQHQGRNTHIQKHAMVIALVKHGKLIEALRADNAFAREPGDAYPQ